MPKQTKTIIAGGGGNYTSIQAFFNDADVSGGYWWGEIQDTAEYAAATLSSVIGVPTSINYVKLSVRVSERHAGVAGTGHARIRNVANGTHCLDIGVSHTQIECLQIEQASIGSSDEGVRLSAGVTGVLISRCIIFAPNNIISQDAIYAGAWSAAAAIDHCIIYGWGRGGVHAQLWSGAHSQSFSVDSCTVVNCGSKGGSSGHGGISIRASDVSASVTMSVYNTFADTVIGSAFSSYGGSGSEIWQGTNNASTDASLTAVGLVVGAQESLTITDVTQPSGSYAVFKNITVGAEDYGLLDDAVGNALYGSGVNRIGSKPDIRQDFTVDIAGVARSTATPSPDIGAHEYQALGYVLNPANIQSTALADSVVATQGHAANVEDLSASSVVGSVASSSVVAYTPAVESVVTASVVEGVAAVDDHLLVPISFSSGSTVNELVITHSHAIGVVDVLSSSWVSSVDIAQGCALQPVSYDALPVLPSVVVSQGYGLQPAETMPNAVVSDVVALQDHILAVNNLFSYLNLASIEAVSDHALGLGNAYGSAQVLSIAVAVGGLGEILNPSIRVVAKTRAVVSQSAVYLVQSKTPIRSVKVN